MKKTTLFLIFCLSANAVFAQSDTVKYVKVSHTINDSLFFASLSKKPQFPNGEKALMEYLESNINCTNKIKSRIIAQFTVEKDGTISNIKITRGEKHICTAAFIEALKKMPKWKPAEEYGKVVRYKMTLPFEVGTK